MRKRRVVITGIGLVAPMGLGEEKFWPALLLGISPLGRIHRFDTTGYPCQVGGEIRHTAYRDLLSPRLARVGTHVAQLAVAAAELARRDAGLPQTLGDDDGDACGVACGTALGGWREGEQQHALLLERGARRVNPFLSNSAPNHSSGAEVAQHIGARGAQLTYSTGCSASTQALTHAASLIAAGEIDLCFAGGSESPLAPLVLAGMGRTMELATEIDGVEHASRPFDRSHNGIVLSEGSCMLVLEHLDHAEQRGAKIYAEVIGGRSACDAQGLYQVDASGAVGGRTIQRLLLQHELQPADVQWVCGHANSSPAFDRKETRVLKQAFGEFAARIPVSSIKAILGHPLGASGAFQAAAACLAIREHIIPPTHFLEEPDEECDLDYVPNVPRHQKLQHVLITSYGYGGVNSYLLLRAPR